MQDDGRLIIKVQWNPIQWFRLERVSNPEPLGQQASAGPFDQVHKVVCVYPTPYEKLWPDCSFSKTYLSLQNLSFYLSIYFFCEKALMYHMISHIRHMNTVTCKTLLLHQHEIFFNMRYQHIDFKAHMALSTRNFRPPKGNRKRKLYFIRSDSSLFKNMYPLFFVAYYLTQKMLVSLKQIKHLLVSHKRFCNVNGLHSILLT